MARSYAQFSTAIWRDPDFLALPGSWQRVYMLLSSQQDVTAVGVLPLAINRWASKAADTTPRDIVAALDGLAQHRFILYDRNTEEVFIRSFVRWDNGYKNPKRLHAIRDAADLVESPAIVAALAAEFDRLHVTAAFRGQCATAGPTVEEPPPSGDETAFPQVDSLSMGNPENQEGASNNRRRVPQPTTHNPQPVPPSAADASATATQAAFEGMATAVAVKEPPAPNAGLIVAAYCDGAKEAGLDKPSAKLCARVGKDAKTLIGEKKNFDKLIAAAKEMGGKGYNDLDVAYRRIDAALNNQQGRLSGGMQPESNAPKAIPAAEKCPRHPSFRAGTCGPCRSESIGTPPATSNPRSAA